MDMMILGETVVSGETVEVHFGFWQPRGGNEGTGAIEVTQLTAGYTVGMQTKNSEDPDPSATSDIIGSTSVSAAGVTRFSFENAKELVRYVLTSTETGSMHFQLMRPQWVPN